VFTPPQADAAGGVTTRIVLQLGAAPQSIAGTVAFADGRPAARVRVWVADPTVVGTGDDTVLAESLQGAS